MISQTQSYHAGTDPLGEMPSAAHIPSNSGVSGVLSFIWLWLAALSRGVFGHGVIHDETPQKPHWVPVNRAQRKLYHHHPNSPLPPARNLAPFYRFGPRVSPTQFLERLCRLSVDGRIRVYDMVYWSSRAAREAFMAIFARGEFRAPRGLCDAHIAPD